MSKDKTLSERAMLVDLSISNWEGRKKDKAVTEDVLNGKRADISAGVWWTRAIPSSELKDIRAAITKSRNTHAKMTLPWSDAGYRILPADMYLDYTSKMRKAEDEFNKAVDAFLDRYPRIIKEAKDRLGDLFREEYFPSQSALRKKFGWRIDVLPLPEATDFRVELGDQEVERIKDNIESQMTAVTEKAIQDLWQRLYDVIERVVQRLDDPEGIFRDSLIGNVRELCDILPKLNITNDPDLEKMRRRIKKKIGKQEPDNLRQDKTVRKEVANEAKSILKKMQGYTGA